MVNWHQIETVFLDMDGTLLDLHYDNYFWLTLVPQRYAEHHELNTDHATRDLFKQFKQHEGSLNWYCLDFWSETLKLDIPKLKQEIKHKIRFRPQVEKFLRQLQESDKETLIVTNAHWDSIRLKLQQTGLERWVDRVLCSHDFDVPKENPVFWPRLQKQHPFDKASTLLIDDSLAVLRSAREYGIAHLLTITQPDSQQPHRKTDEFSSVDHFSDIQLKDRSTDE